jgi:2-haloacid dehalogenase
MIDGGELVLHRFSRKNLVRVKDGMAVPKVLAFDVFGTVVDWRSGIARDVAPFLADLGREDIDPHVFADQWRGLYQPAMEECRSGRRPYTRLDILNRETLEQLLLRHDIDPRAVDETRLHDLAFAWRRLDPWPDAVEGLTRLKAVFPIVTLSNANTALTLAMAKRAGLPWDAILGAEATGCYKPLPGSYLGTADLLGIAPGDLCLVAAHHSDLAAARAAGLRTAYVDRPREYGGAPAPDAHFAQDWDYCADSLIALADRFDAVAV